MVLPVSAYSCFSINYKYLHVIVQNIAAVTNVDGCLYFVTGDNPEFNTCCSYVTNYICHIILQLVLNGCAPYQFKVSLNFVGHFVNMFFTIDELGQSMRIPLTPSFVLCRIYFSLC